MINTKACSGGVAELEAQRVLGVQEQNQDVLREISHWSQFPSDTSGVLFLRRQTVTLAFYIHIVIQVWRRQTPSHARIQ